MPSAKRKSYARSIELYRQVLERQLYRTCYGLKANLLVLSVFSSPADQRKFLQMVGEMGGAAGACMLTATMGQQRPLDQSTAGVLGGLYPGAWHRAGLADVSLAQ